LADVRLGVALGSALGMFLRAISILGTHLAFAQAPPSTVIVIRHVTVVDVKNDYSFAMRTYRPLKAKGCSHLSSRMSFSESPQSLVARFS
jgi:hypothetical protein